MAGTNFWNESLVSKFGQLANQLRTPGHSMCRATKDHCSWSETSACGPWNDLLRSLRFFWSFYFRKWQEMVSAVCCWCLLPLAALFLGVVQLLGAIMCHCWAVLLSCYWVQGILQSPITFWVFDSSVNANHLQMKHLHSSIFRNMIMTVLHMAFGNRTIVHLDGLQLRGRWCSTFCHGLGLDCVVAENVF